MTQMAKSMENKCFSILMFNSKRFARDILEKMLSIMMVLIMITAMIMTTTMMMTMMMMAMLTLAMMVVKMKTTITGRTTSSRAYIIRHRPLHLRGFKCSGRLWS